MALLRIRGWLKAAPRARLRGSGRSSLLDEAGKEMNRIDGVQGACTCQSWTVRYDQPCPLQPRSNVTMAIPFTFALPSVHRGEIVRGCTLTSWPYPGSRSSPPPPRLAHLECLSRASQCRVGDWLATRARSPKHLGSLTRRVKSFNCHDVACNYVTLPSRLGGSCSGSET